MRRYVLDTNVFIEAARNPDRAEELAAFTAAWLPHLHFHAVVAQELLAGATSLEMRSRIERGVIAPFERRGRLVTPTYAAWKRSGQIIAELIRARRVSSTGVRRSLVNDVLLAASCREQGFVVITSNLGDFERIAEVEPVRFVPPWPAR